jgi:hypothetical protein
LNSSSHPIMGGSTDNRTFVVDAVLSATTPSWVAPPYPTNTVEPTTF